MLVENVLLALDLDPERAGITPTHAIEPVEPFVDPYHVGCSDFLSISKHPCAGMSGVWGFKIGCVRKVVVDVFHVSLYRSNTLQVEKFLLFDFFKKVWINDNV